MTIYASDTFAGATGNLIGRTASGGNVWASDDNHGDPIGTALLFDSGNELYCQTADPGDGYLPYLPVTGSPTTSFQIVGVCDVKTVAGKTGLTHGRSGSSSYGFDVGWDAPNNRWYADILAFGGNSTQTGNALTTGVHTWILNIVQGGGGTTATLFVDGVNVITSFFAATFALANPGISYHNTANTSSTGVHWKSFVAQDIPTTPTGTAASLTGFQWDGTSVPVASPQWQGNLSGTMAVGSTHEILVTLQPLGSVAPGGGVVLTPSMPGATFLSPTYTIPPGSSSVVMRAIAPTAPGAILLSVANGSSLTAITNQSITVVPKLLVICSSSLGHEFGVSAGQGFSSLLTGMLADTCVINFSVVGITTEQLTTAAPNQFGPSTGLKGSGPATVLAFELRNSVANHSDTAAAAFAAGQAFYTQAHGWGYSVVGSTVLAGTDYSNTTRLALNALVLASPATIGDKVVPLATDARIGGVGFATNTIYEVGDGVHFTPITHQIVASYFAEAIEPGVTGTSLTAGSSRSLPIFHSPILGGDN